MIWFFSCFHVASKSDLLHLRNLVPGNYCAIVHYITYCCFRVKSLVERSVMTISVGDFEPSYVYILLTLYVQLNMKKASIL